MINVSLDKSVNINNNRSLRSVMLVNARSLFNKSNELEIVAKMEEIDVVCITKTWLKNKIPNEAIDCLGMNLCRLDRANGAGGGVVVYAFGSALENYDWHQIFYGGDIDEKVNRKVQVEGTVKINRLLRTNLNH